MRRCGIFAHKRTWVVIAWTAAAIVVGVVARLTFASPEPSSCPSERDDPYSGLCLDFSLRPLWYYLIALVWLVGLGAIWLVGWRLLPRLQRRRGIADPDASSAPNEKDLPP